MQLKYDIHDMLLKNLGTTALFLQAMDFILTIKTLVLLSHFLYVDDILLYCTSSKRNIETMLYLSILGQMVSTVK